MRSSIRSCRLDRDPSVHSASNTRVNALVGALIRAGDLSLAAVLAATVSGAALGNGAACLPGRSHPDRPHRLWPLSRVPGGNPNKRDVLRERGAIAVFLARLPAVPLVPVVPLVPAVPRVPLVAQSLSGAKRTCSNRAKMSPFDPTATSADRSTTRA